jgi:RimJ/RimL family protein N-acetyltransferase
MEDPGVPVPWAPPAAPLRSISGLGLVIRPYTHADAPALFDAVSRSREALLPWLPWAKFEHHTVAQTTAAIESFMRASADPLRPEHNAVLAYVFGIFDARDGTLLGGTGFNRIVAETRDAETGYWVRADRRREGIASRATAVNLSWGFTPQHEGGLGFRRIRIFAAAANVASCGIPKRLGLHQCMHTRQDRSVEGVGLCDTLGWDVLAPEWDTASHRLRSGA